MDITVLFKNCVRETLKRNSSGGGFAGTTVLPKSRRRTAFITKSSALVQKVTQLRDFLLQHKKAYLNFSPNYVHFEKLSDEERDEIDLGAQAIIKDCSQAVASLKREAYSSEGDGQAAENQRAVIDLVETYLKTVCKIFAEMKAIRVNRAFEFQNMSKLENNVSKKSNFEDVISPIEKENTSTPSKTNTPQFHFEELEENTLSEEELQMFETENRLLYNELNSMNDEVREIQSKVVKIAELQEVFTEKVMQQNEDIERINTTLIGTTENLRDANTQIRQAIQNNAGFRICILFFLIVMSFSLLFLDWYND